MVFEFQWHDCVGDLENVQEGGLVGRLSELIGWVERVAERGDKGD